MADAPSLVGQRFEVEVGPVAHGGHCVARHEGRVIFVRHVLPGEHALVEVTDGHERSRFLRADAIQVLVASPYRRTAPCPYAGPGRCGGCDWQHTDAAHGRRLKADVVAEQLRRLAGLDLPVEVEPVPGDQDGLRWRTRVELAVAPDGHAGLRRHRSHSVVQVEDCLIAGESIAGSGVLEQDWSGRSGVDVVAPSAGEVVVVPLPVDGPVPLVGEQVELADGGWSARFEVSARGFWQVHPGAAAALTGEVLARLGPTAGERCIDLYAGVGLYAAALADRVGPSGAVLAVESDTEAAHLAAANLAGREWTEVRAARVDRELRSLRRKGIHADLVVLDPPRAGAGRRVVADIAALRPRAVAYVACDPAALARDVAYGREVGLRLSSLRCFDAFPMTHHVECVAVLVSGDGSGTGAAG